MDLQRLADTPPWDWPQDVGETLVAVLADRQSPLADRMLAVELAGDPCAMSDTVADALLAIVADRQEPEELRARAATACGPTLEMCEEEGFDQPEFMTISEKTFWSMQQVLRRVFETPDEGKYLRRRALEASVRGREDWHPEAIRTAYASEDEQWKLTAVFCMRFVPGFKAEIIQAARSENEEILSEAVAAAGVWGVTETWPRIARLIGSRQTEKSLLLQAIEAAGVMGAVEALDLLTDLLEAEDDEIADAANEALMELSVLRRADRTAEDGAEEGDWPEDWDEDDWEGEPWDESDEDL
jgi:hypothetical protein